MVGPNCDLFCSVLAVAPLPDGLDSLHVVRWELLTDIFAWNDEEKG